MNRQYLEEYELQAATELVHQTEFGCWRRYARVLGAVGSGRRRVIVDAGSGKGQMIASLNCTRIAVDLSITYLKRSRFYGRGEHRVRGVLEALPLRAGSADVIVCDSVLEHLIEPDLAMAEFKRVLKRSNGRLVICIPYRENIEHYRDCAFHYTHLHTFDDGAINHLLGGFKVRRMENVYPKSFRALFFHYIYGLYYQRVFLFYYPFAVLRRHIPKVHQGIVHVLRGLIVMPTQEVAQSKSQKLGMYMQLGIDRIFSALTPAYFKLVVAQRED